MNLQEYKKRKAQSSTNMTLEEYKNAKQNKSTKSDEKVTLALEDGKEFGTISSTAYRAISNGLLEYYNPKDDNEKKVIDEFRLRTGAELTKDDGSSLGFVSKEGLKAIEENNTKNYKPINDEEKKTINSYIEYATKKRQEKIDNYKATAKKEIANIEKEKSTIADESTKLRRDRAISSRTGKQGTKWAVTDTRTAKEKREGKPLLQSSGAKELKAFEEKYADLDAKAESLVETISDIKKYANVIYNDKGFWGQAKSNYTQGRLNQDTAEAYNDYVVSPTEENKMRADALSALSEQFGINNKDAFTTDDEKLRKPDKAVRDWVAGSFATYLPQLIDQTKASITGAAVGGATGATIGSVVPGVGTATGLVYGIKTGWVAGASKQMFDTTRGMVFKTLVESGYDEKTALDAANDEAFVSSVIEGCGEIISMATLGTGKLVGKLAPKAATKVSNNVIVNGIKGFAKKTGKVISENAFLKTTAVVASVFANAVGEYAEEYSQEAVSIANERRLKRKNPDSLINETFAVLRDQDEKTAERLHTAGQEGFRIGLMMGGATRSGVTGTEHMSYADIGKKIKNADIAQSVINVGLQQDEKSQSNKLATKLSQKDKVSNYNLGKLATANKGETVNIGETYYDTKNKTTLRIVSRDDNETTIEMTASDGRTVTKSFPNKSADNLATGNRYVVVDSIRETTTEHSAETPTETTITEENSTVETATAPENETVTNVQNEQTTPIVTDIPSVPVDEIATKNIDTEVIAGPVSENFTGTDKSRTVAYTNDNQKIDMLFKVVSVDDLIASNELDGRINPNYPQELQPRDRGRVSSQSQISQMSKSLNPARLAESTNVSEGSPIVGSDNVVESGNGRTLAIKLAYESGTAEEYKNFIINNADKLGIDISNLPEKPVLVRERITEVDRTEFTRKANESSIGSLSATEQAKVDAEKLTDDVLGLLIANDDGIINTNDNRDFISAVITKVFKNEDLNNVVNAEGKLSTRGLERITNAIFYKAYGDASLSARLSESLDNDMKNATKVLLNIAPKVVSIKNGISSGFLYNFDFSTDIASAVRLFEKCRNESLMVEDYASQTTIFEKEPPIVLEMAYVFETKNRGAKQATDFYNLLLDTVIGMGDPNQISLDIIELFQTKEEIFNEAIKRFNNGEESTKPITIPESIYRSTSEEGREDVGRGTDEVSRNELGENEKTGTPIGIQQDNGHSEEAGIVTDDEQLRQKNESVEGKSEVTEETPQDDVTLTDKCTLTPTKRTDNGKDIWVVSLNDRISSDEFSELRKIVKQHGGNYSRFAKDTNGKSIPGFIFNNEPSAEAINAFNEFFGNDKAQENTPDIDTQTTEELLKNQSESDTIAEKETANEEGVKNDEPKSEVLAGESGTDDRGLRSESSKTSEQEPIESGNGQLGEDSRETLPQSTGTDGNGRDVRNDSERIHRGNDADISNTEDAGRRIGYESEHTGNNEKLKDSEPETIETEDKSIEKERPSNKENFVITDDIAREFDNTSPSAADNIAAIELLLTLENEGRPATAEEKKILAKYKGWGGINIRALPWELSRKLYDLYNGEQLRDMQSSQNNAFFTPTGVIDAMYSGLKRMGFKGGNVLESSMGVGNFFGRMPVAMTAKSALTGVELESYTARIAQYLYPGATVINKPFQDVAIRNGSYDLVIGNVPFGTNKISYNKKKYSLHNYFIVSSLDKVKDGGVVAVITSSGTLDSYGVDARKAIMDRADVVACYKLPERVFSRNANTDTTTDLLILKKRSSDAKPSGDSILNVTTTDDGLRLNEYFVKHPENVLGTLAKGTNAWGEITTVLDDGNFYDKLNDAMKKLPQGLISGKTELKPIETIVSTNSKPRFFEKNGKIYADDGAGTATQVTSKEQTVRDYMAVRDAYKDLLTAYDNDMSETDIKPLRDKLTKAYDNFSKKHGAITGDGKKKIGDKKSTNNTFLEADADYYLVGGLERYDSSGSKFVKSAVFEKDTLRKKKVTSVDNSSDALAVALNESGKVDFARMSELTGKTEKQLVEDLKGEIVLTPDGDYVLTDIYLSGNIYEKIEKVKGKPEFKEQQEMLEKVLPAPKDASSIMVKLGANYIDAKYIQDFSREIFNTRIEVSKNSAGAWVIEGVRQHRYGDILNVKYGCNAFNAIQLLEKVLNDSEITAKKTIKVDGKSVSVYDEKMTEVARQKAEDIKEAFENWIFRDSERRADIVNKYNRTYNNYRALDYEHIAEKLSFDSMDETLKAKLYPHQKKGIARFLFGGNILFAHGVGTGKTFEMIASVMEAKRMGIVNKTAMVVPNNKVVDFKNDIAQAYPNAKVLVIDTANKKRQTMLGLVNSNDWDIVLIARTTFTKIPVGAELQTNFIKQQLEEMDRQILEAEQDRSISRRKLKGLYTQRDNLEQKLKDLDSDTKRDENSVDFEKLGFDCICVDEAHNYKSITTMTKLDIKGLASGSDAQQANDMLMKLDYMRSIDGKIIFGTGTPITNTVSEIYNMMRMVRPDILEDAGIHSLDEWVNTFAKIDTHTEIGVDNKVKNKSTQTIRSFVNGTEMVGMFRQFADVVFTQDVVKNLPKAVPVVIELEGTEELRQIESEISNTIANASGKEALSAYTKAMAMANAASIDLKMLSGAESDVNIFKDYSLEELEYENSKINTMCNYVYDEYKASNNIKGTQIIFCDGGAGSGAIYSFNVHNDIVQKLIERGIPENEIVVVKNQKDAQLEELFDKVNSGEVRVLIGTSRKMAEGLNVQKRVVAIHHPTVTFKPSDLEQGDARGVRAGNINKEVKIYRYLQGNTFDSYKWQAIDRKGEMINRALRGEAVDELEDIGADDDSGAGVDAATAMAITSGNPLVKEKIDIDKEVKRLKNLKQNYMNEHYRYEDAVAKNPGYIIKYTDFAQKLEQDIAQRDKYGDKAVISINGKTFEKQSDANKALIESVKKAPKNGQFTKLGEYNGFGIMFKGDTGGMGYTMLVKGANEYAVEYTGSGNNIARISGVLNRLTAEKEKVSGRLTRLKTDLEFAKQEVNKPFEREKELTEAIEKQKDITYRYEHFGENKNSEQAETEDVESDETTYYSKRNVDDNSDVVERWTAERVENNADSKKPKKDSKVNIANIVNDIRKKFDIPVATGKVTNPEASAEYRERAESIRTRVANNLPDIAHELGHHLNKNYGLNKLDSVKKLRKAIPDNFLEQYPANEQNTESVAEFVRTYLQSTNKAHGLCSEFYDDFVSTLSKEDLKAINEIANSVNEYMSYDIGKRYGAAITTSKEIAKENASVKESLHELRQKWVDPYLYIKDAVDYVEEAKGQTLNGKGNAYILSVNSLNSHSASEFLLTDGFRDLNGNIIEGAKSFLECISMVGSKDIELLDEYLVLKHSLEWIAPEQEDVTKKRVFGDETLEDVEKIENRIATIEIEHPEFKTAAENLYEYQNNMLKHYLIPTGAMTKETVDTLNRKYPCYVPFYRAVGKDKSLSGRAKSTFVNQKSPIKRAKGSGELIISPLESIIKNTEKFVNVAVRNQVADVLGNYADTVDGFAQFMEPIAPDMIPHTVNINKIKDTFLDELTHISKSSDDYFAVSDLFETIFGDAVTDYSPIANANKKIVTVLRGGKPVYYQVHDDNLYKSIAELSPKQLDGLKAVDFVMNTMKLLITQNNPIFAATNLVRDFGTAYKLSPTNNPVEFTVGYLKALSGIVTNSDDYKQYKAMGGGHSSELTANIENISKTLRKVAEKDMGKARRLAYAIFVHPVETAAMLNDKTESIARFAEFKRTLEAGGDLQEAIYNANDLTTNFRKQGAGTTAKKYANKVLLFNNAAIQGLDKTARTLANKNVQQRNKTWAKWLLHALIMGILGYFYNKEVDEEGYKNLSSYKKNNFYNFAIGDGKFISLPKPRENALLDSVTERAIEYLGGNDDAFYDFGSYLSSQLLPPMIPDDFSSLEGVIHSWLGSTALGGLVDIGFNRDFKGTPIEGKYDEYQPSNERYNENTTKAAYWLGQTKLAREKNLSPKKIDHLISSYTGIIGQLNKALLPMSKERKDKSIGLRNKFISDSNYSTDLLNKMYDNEEKAKLEWQYDDNINNAIEYEQNAVITSYISGMNKAIKALPEDEQREGRKYLLKALNGWNYDLTTEQYNMVSRLENESISKDYIFEELPSSEMSWTVDKQKYTYQMAPQEYNKYISDYLKVIENARKQYGGDSLESYSNAKEAAKDYMSKYKKSLKDKYLSQATKTE